jgi:hypothetical protein
MKVAELKQILEKADDDAEVVCLYYRHSYIEAGYVICDEPVKHVEFNRKRNTVALVTEQIPYPREIENGRNHETKTE